jgi:hypothetical protein
LRGSGGNRDFAGGIILIAINSRDFSGDLLSEDGDAWHRWILIVPSGHGLRHCGRQRGVAIEIRKSLSQIHGFFSAASADITEKIVVPTSGNLEAGMKLAVVVIFSAGK